MSGRHATEEELELYALNRLDSPALDGVEEHLLLCSACQERVQEADHYVTAMRDGLRQLPAPRPSWFARLQGLLAIPAQPALASAFALLLVAGFWASRPSLSGPPQELTLEALRGESAHAKPGRDFLLHLDAKGLPPLARYGVQVVRENGTVVQQDDIRPTSASQTLDLPIHKDLNAGQYIVRLDNPATHEPLREYALELN